MGSWMEAGHEKDEAMIRSLNFQCHPTFSKKRKRPGNAVNDEHAYEIKPPQKAQKYVVQGASKSKGKEVMRTSDLKRSQTEVVGNLGTYYLQLVSESGSGLVGMSP